jgi:DNA-binding transcriptional MerR regulator
MGEQRGKPAPPTYSIRDLAREFDVTTRTIRFYEGEGLISPARRGQTRVFSARDRVRLKLILRGKRLGFSLTEIRELLDLYEVARNERAQLAKFIDMLGERRARLLQQKEDIDAVLAEIEGVERDCRRRLKDEARRKQAGAVDA